MTLPRKHGGAWGAVLALAFGLLGAPHSRAQAQARSATVNPGKATLTIMVPSDGEHFIRFLPSKDAGQPDQLPIRFLDRTKQVSYDLAEVGKQARVAVDDPRTGDSAIRPLTGPHAPRNGVLDLKAPDFDHVRQVDVAVTYDRKPVSLARVSLAPADAKPRTVVLDPAKQGVATYEDVPMGRARVTVLYGDGLSQSQDVEVVSGHAPGPLKISVAVANRVPTVEPTSPSAEPSAGEARKPGEPVGASSSAPAAREAGGGFTGWLGTLLGMAVGAGAIYLLYRWYTSGGMAATLKKAGIEVSGPTADSSQQTPWTPNAPAPPVVADPDLCQFCGQRRDAAGQCACSAVPGSGAAVAAAPGMAQPRLVGTAGQYSTAVFPLSGVMTLGREATNSISLHEDNTVSRRHAVVREEDGAYVIADEGSSNGVYVNGVRITGPQPLRPGDEVQIGGTRFRFEA